MAPGRVGSESRIASGSWPSGAEPGWQPALYRASRCPWCSASSITAWAHRLPELPELALSRRGRRRRTLESTRAWELIPRVLWKCALGEIFVLAARFPRSVARDEGRL